jgi:oxaloacetate decarboxylase alpha subunit
MTPFAQYIVTQATLNVMAGERYKQLSDEIIDLLRGDFGPLPGAVDQDLLDRALSTKRGQQPVNDGGDITITELRKRFGRDLSDEDLLLRAVMPAEQVDAMVAARGTSTRSSLTTLLGTLGDGHGRTTVSLSKGDLSLSVTHDATGDSA